jgi:hypothetical protein
MMNASQLVESFRFWDVVALWAREKLEHETLIARALATGIIRDGLRFQSTDPKWLKSGRELCGNPYVGYCPDPAQQPIILKAETLEHLLAIFRTGAEPSRTILYDEFIRKEDFKAWLHGTDQVLPIFWYGEQER